MIKQIVGWLIQKAYDATTPNPEQEGDKAYRDGKAQDRSPYEPGSEDYKKWLKGYFGR